MAEKHVERKQHYLNFIEFFHKFINDDVVYTLITKQLRVKFSHVYMALKKKLNSLPVILIRHKILDLNLKVNRRYSNSSDIEANIYI